MKQAWFFVVLCFFLPACRDKAPVPRDAAAAPAPAEEPAPPPSPAAAPAVAARPAAATPKQLGSTLRVRVAVGGLPPQDVAAALLHREEFSQKELVQGNDRFALALLRGCEETQLRDPGTRIVVFRNKVGEQGETATASCPARLVQFDPASGLALLTYTDTFKYALDVGFRLARTPPGREDLAVLRTYSETVLGAVLDARAFAPRSNDPNDGNRPPEREPVLATERQMAGLGRPGSVRIQPFTTDFGIYRWASGQLALPKLAPAAKGDAVHLAVGAPDKLLGFIVTSPDGSVVVAPVDRFAVEIKTPVLKAKSLAFDPNSQPQEVRFSLEIENAPAEKTPGLVRVNVVELRGDAPARAVAVGAGGTFAPLENGEVSAMYPDPNTQLWSATLRGPDQPGARVYQVQLAWPLLGGTRPPLGYGQPFLVKLERRPEGVFPSVEGLAAPVAPAAPPAAAGMAQAGPATPFPLESAVRNVTLMAGGREALLELEGAPHWKRFSFAKSEWLPLPAGDLSWSSLTGNLSALFVLDRQSGEVRKFALKDLQPAGAAKLTATAAFIAILAGCNSDHAPVHALSANDAQALDAETLRRRDTPKVVGSGGTTGRAFVRTSRFVVTGDGLTVGASAPPPGGRGIHFYNSDARGLEADYLATRTSLSQAWGGQGVSAAYTPDVGVRCAAVAGGASREHRWPAEWNPAAKLLAPNAPVMFAVHAGNDQTAPPTPPRLALFSFFDNGPFAVMDTPEFSDRKINEVQNYAIRAYSDPYSLRVGTLAPDRRTWFVRRLTAPETRDQPVLLNWPDTSVARGGEFRFQPQLLGGKKFTAALHYPPGLAVVREEESAVRFPWAATDPATLKLLTVTVPGKVGAGLSYPIPLHASGVEPALVARANADRTMFNSLGTSFRAMNLPTAHLQTLPATLHHFPEPIVEIAGPVAGCAVLRTPSHRLDFFSLETRKVTGQATVSPGVAIFAGAGAVFAYDPVKRSLTRISVPDGRHGAALHFPDNVTLTGIGMGTEAKSPVTLALRFYPAKEPTRVGDLELKSAGPADVVSVRDGQLLQTAGWRQPVSLDRLLGRVDPPENGTFLAGDIHRPAALPTMPNGRTVHLGGRFLACSPAFAVVYPLPGLAVAGTPGGGLPFARLNKGNFHLNSPRGRYSFIRLARQDSADECLQVLLTELNKPLLLAGRLAGFLDDGSSTDFSSLASPILFGDHGPLGILDKQRRTLNLTDLDVPALMKTLTPDDFHVTSQPEPCLMVGATLQYQVQVNNPAAVQTYRLRAAVPGAQLTPQGLLKYTAPTKITEATKASVAIEIVGQKGQVDLHEFEIHILPKPPSLTEAI